MKATPTTIACNSNDTSTTSVSKAGDVMMTSSSQKEGILKKSSILPKKDPPEGKTTTIVAMMRGRPKPGQHRQSSNKHYKQNLVRVLLDSGSDSNLVFIDKEKPMLLPSSKKAGSTLVEYFKWDVSDQGKGWNQAELLWIFR